MSMATMWGQDIDYSYINFASQVSHWILIVSLSIFPSLFCPSARMTKWCVPEPKKFSVSLRRRRSTSCDHSDQPQLNINTIDDGLPSPRLRSGSFRANCGAVIQCPSPLQLHPICQPLTHDQLKAAGSSFRLISMWPVNWKSFKFDSFQLQWLSWHDIILQALTLKSRDDSEKSGGRRKNARCLILPHQINTWGCFVL